MKILSLFDGMACGALAMQAAGIEIEKYIAYEVDKYAIQTAQHNFPFIEERGDVFKADFTQYVGFDYLIGGSPCTYWSIAQTKNRETVASGMGWELFSQYVRALHEAKPRFFLYENNKSMSAAIRASITETFGFEPILINSALVSAQNRQRLYWCGIRQEDGTYRKADIQQPADRGILLKDILETNGTNGKCATLTTCQGGHREPKVFEKIAEPVQPYINEIELVNYKVRKDSEIVITDRNMRCAKNDLKHSSATESIVMLPNAKSNALITAHGVKVFEKIADPVCVAQRGRYDESGKVYQHYETQPTGKTNNLTTVSKDNLIAEPICVNSKSGRAGVEGLQPSLQDRVYDTTGKMPAVTSSFNPKIAEPVQPLSEKEMNYMIRDHQDQRWNFCNKPGQEDKSKCLVANVHKGVPYNILAEPVNITKDGKAGTLRATCRSIDAPIYEVKDGFITVKGNKYPIKLVDGFYIIRKLTVRECMRLQTVPEWYEWPVSKSQAYKMLGNGWTVDVIAHLLRGLK